MYQANNELPLYHQIKQKIIARIENGEFKPNEKIPAESELCDEYNVSRITIRRAIDEMVKVGLLIKRQGKGTFINKKKINFFSVDLVSFVKRMKEKEFDVQTKILSIVMIEFDSKIFEELNMKENDMVYEIKRLRLIKNEPISFEISYVPQKVIEGYFNLSELKNYLTQGNSLYDLLNNQLGIELDYAKQTFEPILLNDNEKEILKSNNNPVGLLIYRTTYFENRPIEYVKVIHRGDNCKFEMELKK